MAAAVQIVFTEEELLETIYRAEIEQNVKFVKHRKKGSSVSTGDINSLTGFRVWFEDPQHSLSVFPSVPYNGVPFIIFNTETYECHQGPQRGEHLEEEKMTEDHSYQSHSRKKIQTTKKRECPAKLKVRRVIKFPEYKIIGEPTQRKKRTLSEKLKQEFSQQTEKELLIHLYIAAESDHKNHLLGEMAGFNQPIDKRVICRIKELASSGHRNVASVKIILEDWIHKEISPEAAKSNRRFFPSNNDIGNHIYHAVVGSNLRSAHEDQMSLRKMVESLKQSNPKDKYLFRPASSDGEDVTSMLLVLQTNFQQRLLERYGEITLMDATYKTTKYEIPLYNLCVQTNVGFFIVASFFLSTDTKNSVQEALEVIKRWNSSWKPKHFMCDFDVKEIGAIESTFKDTTVLLCDFHRDRAWQRWLNSSDIPNKSDIVKQLREIASAETEEAYHLLVETMKKSTSYTKNEKFRNWLDKKWLRQEKRWAFCYRRHLRNIISTTNGIETQYKDIKHHYLKEFGIGKSLTNVTEVLLEKFFPDAKMRFVW
ncbi:hypothetical protein ScPMuIL_015093 [Solemya velum]